ncbi:MULTISPECIES: LysR family transcriptional regulator [unclassified Streptosporangium]|uniref:LysR family transcriptional regulator n=1 Tax=unclassified Streptosporangium TaxID=2632669 RepID=UPI002E2CC0E2|nr:MULTISPECIES: LysR family transcriptional regulator [unclassified Streptosporangium]
MDLDLGLVADFLVLVQERHYGRAAVRLHLTSSALTKRIQRLERQVGVALVERDPAGVLTVTSAGRRFATAAVPLIAQAGAARESARATPARYTVRIGVPAGTGAILGQIDMSGIAREVRSSFPETRLVRQDIAFPSLTRCLPERQVDLLWTFAPVRHPIVDSFPLAVVSARIGVVAARHSLADAEAMNVEDFSEQPILYNPVCPEEWMSQFWLGDVRPRHEARLIETDAGSFTGVLRRTADGTAVIATVSEIAPLLGSAFRAVTLTGAAPVAFHVACRRTDRRGAVHALLKAFQALGPRLL